MQVVNRPFDGVIILEPKSFFDERGFFLESFEISRYNEVGINENFVQENHSRSYKNVLRGLHYTKVGQQAQLLTVLHGSIYDVVVDIRPDSKTFKKWFGIVLSDKGPRQIFMKHGFAHGFCTLSDVVDLHYKVTNKYDASDEGGIIWNDCEIGIQWPINNPLISERDRQLPTLSSCARKNEF